MRVVVVGATGNLGTSTLRSLVRDARVDSILGGARRRPEVEVPKVDATNVIQCCVATSDIGGPPSADVVVTLDAALPQLSPSAPVYYLAPPATDPTTFVTQVGQALSIQGHVLDGVNAFGRRELWYADPGQGAVLIVHFATASAELEMSA